MADTPHLLLHASCISIGGRGVLLLGESGSGKSDVALRLIERGAILVSDDQVEIRAKDGALHAFAPKTIEGLLEARGVGILKVPCVQDIALALAVRLVAAEAVERMPEPQFFDCLGLQLPLLSLHAFEPSISAKIGMALQARETIV